MTFIIFIATSGDIWKRLLLFFLLLSWMLYNCRIHSRVKRWCFFWILSGSGIYYEGNSFNCCTTLKNPVEVNEMNNESEWSEMFAIHVLVHLHNLRVCLLQSLFQHFALLVARKTKNFAPYPPHYRTPRTNWHHHDRNSKFNVPYSFNTRPYVIFGMICLLWGAQIIKFPVECHRMKMIY